MISAGKIFIVIIFITSFLYPQDKLREQFLYASKLYFDEEYFDAITEFKRLIFFDNQSQYIYQAYDLIGKSYKKGAKFSDAVYYFTLAEINATDDEEYYNAVIEKVRVNILRRTTQHALKLLDSLESRYEFYHKRDEIYYWRGWAYIFADNWEEASLSFEKIHKYHDLKLYCQKVSQAKYSKTLAKILSFIIPGAGQIYTGNYISGLISLGWNILWGYVTIDAFIEERIFDGLMVGNLLWLRFYRGNIQNAEKFVEEKNLEITNEALFYLQYNYKGLKP